MNPPPMDSLNPYEAPSAPLFEGRIARANWFRAFCVAAGYWVVAVFLFGLLPPYLKMRDASPSLPLTFENLSPYADDKFFVALGLAGPLVIAAAILDFAPRKRLGVIRSFAISGGVLMAILFVIVFCMLIYDSVVVESFVLNRNSRQWTTTPAYWGALSMGDLIWLAAMAFILKRRIRETVG